MALIYGLRAEMQTGDANSPHVVSFKVARSVADDTLLEIWNGATVAAIKATIDKDGKFYSAALTAGDILFAVTGGISNVLRLDSLAIGATREVLQVNAAGTLPEWTDSLSLAGSVSMGALTAGGVVKLTSTDDVDLAGISGALIIGGDGTGAHLALDGNEIMAKGGATAAATLNLNAEGGDILLGSFADGIRFDAGGSLEPTTTGAVTLGSTILRWGDAFMSTLDCSVSLTMSGAGDTGGLSTATGQLRWVRPNGSVGVIMDNTTFTLFDDLIPNTALNLGTALKPWGSAFVGALTAASALISGALEIDGDLNHDGSNAGFYATDPIAKPTGVAVSSAGIHAALVSLGLIAA